MEKNKDNLEQHLREGFQRLAEAEEQKITEERKQESDHKNAMPEGTKESVRARLDHEIEKIREQEEKAKEKTEADSYIRLSAEDRRALELGRRALQEEKNGIHRRRRPLKVYLAVAAVIAATLAVSVGVMGGPERVVQMARQAVGGREVEKVNSSDENLTSVNEDIEEAYQITAEKFGTEPVRILAQPSELKFEELIFDELNQVAEFWYEIKGERMIYFVSASYRDSSWGVDTEDVLVDSYLINEGKENQINVKEYQVTENGERRFSAQFFYKGLEYYLIGVMSEKDFLEIVNNLLFY